MIHSASPKVPTVGITILNLKLFCNVLQFWDGRTDMYEYSDPTGRDCGVVGLVDQQGKIFMKFEGRQKSAKKVLKIHLFPFSCFTDNHGSARELYLLTRET